MAKKKLNFGTPILIITLVTCTAGLLSMIPSSIISPDNSSDNLSEIPSGSNSNNSDDNTSNNDVNPVKNGWYLVNNVNELHDGDYVTFISSINDTGKLIGQFLSDSKKFTVESVDLVVESEYLTNLVTEYGDGSFFQLVENEGGFAFLSNGLYITSAYSSSNTCKMTNVLDQYSTFDVSFASDYVIATARGDKKCNTIKYGTTYFSLYEATKGDFPYMVKWYGEENPYIKSAFNPDDYTSIINLNEWEFVDYTSEDFEIYDGLEFIPVYIKNNSYYLPELLHEQVVELTSEFVLYDNALYGYRNYLTCQFKESDIENYYNIVFNDEYFQYLSVGDSNGYFIIENNEIVGYTYDHYGPFRLGFSYSSDFENNVLSSEHYFNNLGFEDVEYLKYILVKK